jgi:catechol 2,3-dioxygenase-like lactoylglutathione lyase family enzyme
MPRDHARKLKRFQFVTAVIAILWISVFSLPAQAQLAQPNGSGVTLGHIHIYTQDMAAQQRFWGQVLGLRLVHNEKLDMYEMPGVYIIVSPSETPVAPPEGSIVNHFGIVIKDLPAASARWQNLYGMEIEPGGNPNQGYLHGPDGIRVEFFGNTTIDSRWQMNHIHFFPSDIPAMQTWYGKIFGGVIGTRARVSSPGRIESVDVPGVNLSFSWPAGSKASERNRPLEPTKGRSLDHIGFEVVDLDSFVKSLESQGIKIDEGPRASRNSSKLKVAYITDPWGTRIELTEGLAPAAPAAQ